MLQIHASEPLASGFVIEARSNVSMSLDGLSAVFAGLCAVTLIVVAWPVFMGLWPILLAALAHLAAVGWCFRAAWRSNWARERLRIDGENLVVEQFRLGRQTRTEWPVAWARVVKHAGRFGDVRVFISHHGRRQEIGAFLPVSERDELAGMLNALLQRRSAWNGTQNTRTFSG